MSKLSIVPIFGRGFDHSPAESNPRLEAIDNLAALWGWERITRNGCETWIIWPHEIYSVNNDRREGLAMRLHDSDSIETIMHVLQVRTPK